MTFIGIDVSGLEEVKKMLEELPKEIGDAGVERANDYIVEFERLYPDSKKGQPFVWTSDKQRKAYFASNGFGEGIPYQRKFRIRWGWKKLGKGMLQIVVNEVPYAHWVKDKEQQIGFKVREWTTIAQDLVDRLPKIKSAFEKGVREAIKKAETK